MKKILTVILFLFVFQPIFSQNTYLEINLDDIKGNRSFPRASQPLEIFNVIEKAANDDNIKGIILNIGSFYGQRDYLWELRSALENFKLNDKKICAFFSYADIDTYNLASVADKIVMDELGSLNILGYSMNMIYAKQALEKLGIGVRELRYLEYKSAGEMFARDSMSDADRRQNNDYLDDIFNLTRKTLMDARNWTNSEFELILNRDFMFSANGAQTRGLVDFVGRKDAVHNALYEMEGFTITNFVLYGNTDTSVTGSKNEYKPPRAGGLFRKPPIIAVVYAEGQTDMERGLAASSLTRTIRELADNNRVKAIIIRINSPGGSAIAADYLDSAVRYAKIRKPVVVSMGQMAASGGYWAAMNANHILATPYTITGSIGVIGSWFYDNGMNEKLGLRNEVLKRGTHSDLTSGFLFPYRNLTAQEEGRYRIFIMDMYDTFVKKVAAGRSMSVERVEAAAQGRIFSGTRALEAGLIDSIGGLSDAIRIARSMTDIPNDRNVLFKKYPEPKFMEKLMESFPSSISAFISNLFKRNIPLLPSSILPEDILYRLEHNGQIMPIIPMEFCY